MAATCATAGIIVGVVTLTGLGLKFSQIILTLAGQSQDLIDFALVAAAVVLQALARRSPLPARPA